MIVALLSASVLTGLFSQKGGPKVYRWGAAAHALAFIFALFDFYAIVKGGNRTIGFLPLNNAGNGSFHFSFLLDRLSCVMAVLISGISTLIYIYSIQYMEQERGRARHHTFISLTTTALVCMVSSSSLLMLFVFWQLISWFIWLLSYNYGHLPTVRGSYRTFTIARIGDGAFLAGLVIAYAAFGTLDFQELFEKAAGDSRPLSLWPFTNWNVSATTIINLLIFVGAMSKSVQFPLHSWIIDSLYAPTPVTALLHAGIINAGGFLLNRLAPLFGQSSITLHVVFAVGALTALLGASMMLVQSDIKKQLGYSTIGQMGYMIMECGLGAFAMAIFHLIAHGLFKATNFLNSGNVIHKARMEPLFPPREDPMTETPFSYLTWTTGFFTTLILPLIILLGAHGVLDLNFAHSQGVVIFLFFSWVTSSQAILTLYRLQPVASRKVAALMLFTFIIVVVTYLFAAEGFTRFLYPSRTDVAFYFKSASLPGSLFDLLVGTIAIFVIFGWVLLYSQSHGKLFLTPAWLSSFQDRLYLFFINRLYIDFLAPRLTNLWTTFVQSVIQGRTNLLTMVFGFFSIGLILPAASHLTQWSTKGLALFLVSLMTLPLFPFHGLYVIALTRTPARIGVWASLVLPSIGFYSLSHLLFRSNEPVSEITHVIGTLSILSAFFAMLKAMAQARAASLISYFSLSFYSVLWWSLMRTGAKNGGTVLFFSAVTIGTTGLLFAWQKLEDRYGSLEIIAIRGLARPMPRFSVLLSILTMAMVGLPPFGVFSGFILLILNSNGVISPEQLLIVIVWISTSWYLFGMMQRLLFGPCRNDMPYDDLMPFEMLPIVAIIFILLLLGSLPLGVIDNQLVEQGSRILFGKSI